MKYINNQVNVEDLIIIYLSEKLKNGYFPFFGNQELEFFLYYMNERENINGLNNDYEIILKKTILKHRIKTIDKMSHIDLDSRNMVRPTYKFSYIDAHASEININNKEQREKIKKLINEYLTIYPKRKIIIINNIEENNLKYSKILTTTLIEIIWHFYTIKYIESGNWPKKCLSIEKYLINNDLSFTLELPSIRSEIINFYKTFSKRLASVLQIEKSIKISNEKYNMLAYSNYLALIKDYENLFGLINGIYFNMSIEKANNYLNHKYNPSTKTLNLVKTLDNVK